MTIFTSSFTFKNVKIFSQSLYSLEIFLAERPVFLAKSAIVVLFSLDNIFKIRA